MTVSDLYHAFADFFAGFSLYIREEQRRINEAAIGGVGAQRPVFRANEPKKTDACSARALTRGQNPLE
jgi:hypothetical protein